MHSGDHHTWPGHYLLVLILASLIPFSPQLTEAKHRPPTPNPQAAIHQIATRLPTPTPSPSPTVSAQPTPPARARRPARPPKTIVPATAGSQYGIAAGSGLPGLAPAELARQLDDIKALGVGWVRFDIEWSNIEYAGPGQYDWASYDRVALALRARGLQPLAILDYTPAWARQTACADTSMCAPADPTAYGRFAAAAAAHYRPLGIKYWEIWNEPNSRQFFQPGANAASYAALLKAAYPAIKQVDPSAYVLTAGTAPASTGNGYLSAPDFLRGLYAAGAKGYFDAVGHHPYTFPWTPVTAYPGGAWDQITTLHAIMAANGDGAKKVWLTEYGAPTGGPGPTATTAAFNPDAWQVDETLQATMVHDAIAKYRTLPWAGPMFWYTYIDPGTTRDTNENFFGLVRHDGSRKPAYATFKAAISQ